MNLGLLTLALAGVVGAIVVAAFVRKLSRKLDRRLIVTTAAGLAIGVLTWVYLAHGSITFTGVLLLTVAAGAGWVAWRRGGTARTVTRWGERTRRRSGVATPWQILRVGSAAAMRRKAPAVRPSLRETTRRDRAKTPTREFAVQLCRTGGMNVWASLEDVVLVFGGPRTGKTAWLGGAVIDAPGAVVTTSTRLDLYDLTHRLRATGGRQVWVFNPGGLGGLPSTVTFDPLQGCDNPQVAIERATDMIPVKESSEGERDFWDSQARRVLAALMHAAALGHGTHTMRDVLRWVSSPTDAGHEVQRLLKRSPEPAFGPDVQQFVGLNPTTQSSVTTGIMPALQWLTSADAVAATRGGQPFDVAELIRGKGTVYMLGRHEAHTAPLLAALTGYIARDARRLAAMQPGGRLDPPLSLKLDEAARVSPVPLPDWSGDSGGSGLQLTCAFQSRADLLERWGTNGTAKVLNNAGSIMLFGGTKDAADLDFWSKLSGDRDEPVKTRNGDGKVTSTSVRKTPVLAPAQLANLPARRVVVYTRGMPPVVGRVARVWERRDVRAVARATPPSPIPAGGRPAPAVEAPPAQSPTRELTDVAH